MQNQPEERLTIDESPSYGNCVFINCPFDPSYQQLFRAIVFAIYDCGFIPRCVLEDPGTSETRIEKLYRIISECRFGIHDISATDLDDANNLPRFNMPLELGIFLGALKFDASRSKRCLILDREEYRYQIFCSDLAGHDPEIHLGTPEGAIRCVRNWLNAERLESPTPGWEKMFERFQQFCDFLPFYCSEKYLEPNSLTFSDLITVVSEWLQLNEQWDDGGTDPLRPAARLRLGDSPQ